MEFVNMVVVLLDKKDLEGIKYALRLLNKNLKQYREIHAKGIYGYAKEIEKAENEKKLLVKLEKGHALTQKELWDIRDIIQRLDWQLEKEVPSLKKFMRTFYEKLSFHRFA